MDAPRDVLPLLRLLQLTDSSFPVGGYAYSHGLEWLVSEGRVTRDGKLAEVLATFTGQAVRRQWLPAAGAVYRTASLHGIRRVDHRLDASLAAQAEREAGRAMGRRLLEVGVAVLPGPSCEELLASVREDKSPGQFGVAFAAVARDSGVGERDMLAALGYSMVSSMTQAAIRLGVIGPQAATSLNAAFLADVDAAVDHVTRQPRPRVGSFAPGLELAVMLQPTLRFRMFAS